MQLSKNSTPKLIKINLKIITIQFLKNFDHKLSLLKQDKTKYPEKN